MALPDQAKIYLQLALKEITNKIISKENADQEWFDLITYEENIQAMLNEGEK